MIPAGPFRFALPEGHYYAFDFWLRGKWRRGHRFGESQDDANKRAIEYFQHLGGGNVRVIRRADTREVIWEKKPNRQDEEAASQTQVKEIP